MPFHHISDKHNLFNGLQICDIREARKPALSHRVQDQNSYSERFCHSYPTITSTKQLKKINSNSEELSSLRNFLYQQVSLEDVLIKDFSKLHQSPLPKTIYATQKQFANHVRTSNVQSLLHPNHDTDMKMKQFIWSNKISVGHLRITDICQSLIAWRTVFDAYHLSIRRF